MFLEDITKIKHQEKLLCECDECHKIFSRRKDNAIKIRKKRNTDKDYCRSCASKLCVHKKPQCNKTYWTQEKRDKHSQCMKNSETYYQAIANRDQTAERNGMFGRKHTAETRQKMSISRTGKIGPQATAWKGGKDSLNKRIRKIIHTKYNWYKKVYQRDNFSCTKCGSKTKIDAHHIKPISKIIKELLSDKNFITDEKKILWLIQQDEIIDINLQNGITLCRNCHRKVHMKWGSHTVQLVQE